ncbi:hypothetical protein [Pseudoalteromonas marina]|uniref:Uncharacterized protein n=1 Tax=Pseudoalteromonas marina TaxID=267375 RepID=A0ABT9FI66_9GAMM|nr:hypothetical protein [Pseudoalteromonas marina]MDP2566462.1 hypothetical protein [Pseudoalteromonas marina]
MTCYQNLSGMIFRSLEDLRDYYGEKLETTVLEEGTLNSDNEFVPLKLEMETNNDAYIEWRERVIEFVKEEESNFKPDHGQLKMLWKWGASAGGAANDCLKKFRSKAQN